MTAASERKGTTSAPAPAAEPAGKGKAASDIIKRAKKPAAEPSGKPKADAPKDKPAEPAEGATMSFWDHLDELRKRLVWSVAGFFAGCFVAWEVREPMLDYLSRPFRAAWASQQLPGTATLHFGTPSAAFMAYMKLSMLGGAAMAAPFVFYQLWAFVAPGLYAREKRYVIPFVLFATTLFIGGGFFAYKTAFPLLFDYFLSMSGPVGGAGMVNVAPTIMMGDYIDFVVQMLFAFGLIFEIPLVILFLSVAGIVNYLQLIRFGRWFVLVAFIFAAVITPPDVTSQMLMAIPMCVLYVASIGLAFVFGKKPTEAQLQAFRKRKP